MSWWNKIQWSRLDEIILFLIVSALVVVLVAVGMKWEGSVPSEVWPIVAMLVTAVARTLKRNGNGNGGDENHVQENAPVDDTPPASN